jgi:DNA-binding GntR family transcriptional regulator
MGEQRKRVTAKAAPSADDKVFRAIFDAVQAHRLLPGVKLRELELTRLFNVSRASVRTALKRLAHTGLVAIEPHRGAVVTQLTPQDCADLFEARRAVEGAAVELLARKASPAALESLRAHANAQKEAFERGDEKQGQRLAISFHALLAELSGNRLLASMARDLLARMPLVILTFGRSEPGDANYAEHIELVQAIAARDADRARRILHDHLQHVQRELEASQRPRELSLAEMLAPA